MRRSLVPSCGAIALALLMLLALGNSSAAWGQQVDVRIQITRTPSGIDIRIQQPQGRFVGLCRSGNPNASPYNNANNRKPQCDGDQFEWTLAGNALDPGETLRIMSAPNHADCFQNLPRVFHPTTGVQVQLSGPAKDVCALDKYGYYWPYVIVLYDSTGGILASTDPGGIIFP